MCTICGMVTDEPDSEHSADILSMLATTRHRGPDACGVWSSGHPNTVASDKNPEALAPHVRALTPGEILLGQSRLAITGGADAIQPFTSRDGRLAFAHNGEIYNHDELRSLLPKDAQPDSDSDSEVLARIVELHYHGDLKEAVERAITMADGMYALAVSDGQSLVLARDPIGKKPIYYVEGPPFVFASERKALVPVAARHGGGVIRRLLPGEILTAKPGEPPVVDTFETITMPPVDILDEETAVDLYEEALTRAIERRTRHQTKAAVLFSGGVDSVLVARLLQNAGLDVTGYTMGMDGSGDVKASEEVAKQMGIKLKVARVDAEMLENELPRIIRAAEVAGPLQAEVSIPMWYASKMAHEDGHRVIFTGQAADELFAGYDWYRKVVAEHDHIELHARTWEDVRMLPVDTLEREDRITMAHQLELRAPFLDHDVIRVAMRIAPQIKLHDPDDLMRKHTHRQVALRAGVPESVALREKSPAQDGANVHTLLDMLAERRFKTDAEVPEAVAHADFGSNYRYRDTMGAYASPRVHALLAAIVRENDIPVADEACEIIVPAQIRSPIEIVSKPAPSTPPGDAAAEQPPNA